MRGSKGSKVAIAYNLFKIIGNINIRTEYKLSEVYVPLISCGTVGVILPRDRHYKTLEINRKKLLIQYTRLDLSLKQ